MRGEECNTTTEYSLSGTFALNATDVPRIGYGMGALTHAVGAGKVTRADARALLDAAWLAGMRLFDTAAFYGDGLANSLLKEAVAGSRADDVVLCTKVGARPVPGPVPMTAAQRPHELREAVDANLAQLGVERLGVVYLRRMDAPPGLIAEGEQVVPIAEQLAEMIALRDQGKIAGIGLSHVSAEQYVQAEGAGIVAVQNLYHLLGREDEEQLRRAEASGAAWIPYFPLGGGGWAGLPKVTDDPEVQAVAGALGLTPSQVGLAWQLARSPNTMVVSGTSSPEHLQQNLAVGDVVLPAEVMDRLDAAGGTGPA